MDAAIENRVLIKVGRFVIQALRSLMLMVKLKLSRVRIKNIKSIVWN